jgi:hypothetical protein
MPEIRARDVLQSVLIQILKEFEDGASIATVYEEIERRFALPQEWLREIPAGNGHIDLQNQGVADWRDIPQERLVQMVPTEPQWQNETRWARNELREAGFLDMSVPRGIWKLTEQGQKAAGVTLERLTPAEKQIATPRQRPKVADSADEQKVISEHALSSREMLENKLRVFTSSMPLDDLRLLVDIARVVRLRSVDE